MAFFSEFPHRLLQIGPKESIVVKDIIRAVRVDPNLKTNPLFYVVTKAADDETPEMLSHRFYGTTAYHWVVMLMNERFDPYEDFPKSDRVLRKYCEAKYDDILGTHHWENEEGHQVDELTVSKVAVTNYEYEIRRNEELRQVKILKNEVLSEFVSAYIGTITNG